MAEIEIKTGKARQTHRRPTVVGYTWVRDVEYEVLSCGHKRPVETEAGYVHLEWDDEEEERVLVAGLTPLPRRRICQECKVEHKGLSTDGGQPVD